MRKLSCFAFLFLSAVAFAQTVTVSGHTITGQNAASSSGISILWELTNDGGQQCKVAGTGLLTPMSFSVTQAQLAAGISMLPNSSITCGTTTGASRWRYTIKSGGTGTRQCSLNITGATNLDSTACLNATSTPVTATPTDSVYARLDGSNAGFTGAITGTSFNFSGNGVVGGTLGVGSINGILTVDGTKYTTIDAAMADCSSTGCIIRVKAGTLPCPTGAITKPIILEGAGPGGFATALDTSYSSGTVLTNSSTTANCITVGGSLTTAQALNGVVIRDLAIQGNKNVGGASTGDGISFVGGDSTTQLTNSVVKNVFVHDAKGVGISIKENVFGLNIEDTQIAKNGSHGIAVSNSGTGGPSQIRLARVFDWLNTGDGLNMSGTNVHDVSATQSTFANNLNGVNVAVGSTIAAFIAGERCDFEQNTNAGVLLSDGFGHAVRDSQFPADGTQLYGINANFPAGAGTALVQLTLANNSFSTNLTEDINIASAKVVMIYPQSSNNYSYADASGNAVRINITTFGGLKFTGIGLNPASNGVGEIGDPSDAWGSMNSFSYGLNELTAPSAAGARDICYGDSTAHALECSYNAGSFSIVPLVGNSQTWTGTQTFAQANKTGQADIVADSGAINTAETIIVKTSALDANRLVAGTHIRATLTGTCTASAANTSTFTVRMGTAGTTADTAVSTAVLAASATTGTNIPFKVILDFTVRTVGASATGFVTLELQNQGTTGISSTVQQIMVPSMSTFNTTTAGNIISFSYKTAASTTTSIFKQAVIEFVYD